MDNMNKSTFGKLKVASPNDEALDMTNDERAAYIISADNDSLKIKEGEEPLWFYFKPMTYKDVVALTEDSTKTANFKAVEAFKLTFLGVSRTNGEIKSIEKLLSENPDFSGEDAILNMMIDVVGFDGLVALGHMSLYSSYIGKKNKRSLA